VSFSSSTYISIMVVGIAKGSQYVRGMNGFLFRVVVYLVLLKTKAR